MANLCVIFDLDGTLVDSETLCNQAFLHLLPQLDLPLEQITEQYRGKKLSCILADIEQCLNTTLSPDFETIYRQHVSNLFARNLQPIAGVTTMLRQLEYPKCIASSGPLQKIKQALTVSGLAPFFGHNLFSSYQINSWKPEPDIFLHAAFNMGFLPQQCVVIEDSEVGIIAAKAAGMAAFYYSPAAPTMKFEGNVTQFDDMTMLPRLLGRIA